jgi:hypothetical protein
MSVEIVLILAKVFVPNAQALALDVERQAMYLACGLFLFLASRIWASSRA